MAELPDTLRLLVVSSQQEPLREVVQALGQRAGQIDLHWASRPILVPFRVRDLRPHIILLYDDLGDDRIVAITRRLSTMTDASIMVMVAERGAQLARRAVFAGARGFLIRPLTAEQVESVLAEAAQGRGQQRRRPTQRREDVGRIIVFCSPKGGTGRTTLAVNSSIAIHALTGKSVILMDADYAAPAVDVALDLRDAPDVSLLLPRLGRLDEEFVDAVLARHHSGVRVLLAPPPAENAAPKDAAEVRGVLEVLRGAASWVVVDLGLPIDERARAFLTRSDLVVVNVLPEAIGLRNARRLLAGLWEQGIAPDATRVVLNRADISSGLEPGAIREHLGIPIAFEIPDDQTLATASVNRGAPIVLDYRYTTVATAVRDFSRRIVRDMTGAEPVGEAKPPRRWPWAAVGGVAGLVVLIAGLLLIVPDRLGLPTPMLAGGSPTHAATVPESPTPGGSAAGDAAGRGPSQGGVSATDTRAPTATRTPLAAQTRPPTRTRIPTRTLLPTPSPTPTLPVTVADQPPPRLLGPANGASVGALGPPVLSWSWDGELAEDASFVLALAYRHNGATRYVDVPWTRETSLDASSQVGLVSLADDARFYWSVKVVQYAGTDANARPLGVPLSPMSEVRTFVWEGATGAPRQGE